MNNNTIITLVVSFVLIAIMLSSMSLISRRTTQPSEMEMVPEIPQEMLPEMPPVMPLEMEMPPEMLPEITPDMGPETVPAMDEIGLPLGVELEGGLAMNQGTEIDLGVAPELGPGMGPGMDEAGLPMDIDPTMVSTMDESGLPADTGMMGMEPQSMPPIQTEGSVEGFGSPGNTLLSCSLLIILVVFLFAYMYWDSVSQMEVVKRFR